MEFNAISDILEINMHKYLELSILPDIMIPSGIYLRIPSFGIIGIDYAM